MIHPDDDFSLLPYLFDLSALILFLSALIRVQLQF